MEAQSAVAKVDLTSLTADVVAAYVSGNKVAAADLPSFIQQVHAAISTVSNGHAEPEPQNLVPAVPIKNSVKPDFIICLEDGKKFKSLKRHLKSSFNMSPEEYRVKWGLRFDYPMVAPAYAAQRSQLAKTMGLGSLRKNAKAKAAPTPTRVSKAVAKTGPRRKKAVR